MSLSNFQQYKNREAGVIETNPQLRPKNVKKVRSIPQAETWRNIVMGEISSKLTQINDPNESDFRLRELNDELNQLFRDKKTWEYQIKALGGNDYIHNHNKKDMINSGANVAGWRYFGRAKELPDIKKSIEESKKQALRGKVSKAAILKARKKRLDDFYYGKGEDDRELCPNGSSIKRDNS
ncbi:uncharacterized protein LODBEIA_P60880 [Lodderomyces beijingensis]|uniref:Pre-mRNA-splicing factor ISY1 n=1 Tax=Lodderomyces beijingensis TaxID=1775926 RepID=A0ABP0ZUQ1_9ASCO